MTPKSLAQSLLDLESSGATGRLRVTSADGDLVLIVSHGRLGLDGGDDVLDERGRARLHNYGFDVEDSYARSVAAVDDLTASLASAFRAADASWDFTASDESPAASTPTTVVVRDARRRVSENDRLLIHVPSDASVADRIRGADTSTAHLSRLLGNVYAAIDGSRSITDLGRDLGIGNPAVRRSVFRLASMGLIRFDRAVAPDAPASNAAVATADWAESSLAEAVEEPEPWIGYARGGGPDVSPPKRRPPGAPSGVKGAEAADGVGVDAAASRRVDPPNRTRPVDPEERRESLRQAAAWLADIDHHENPAAAGQRGLAEEASPTPSEEPQEAPTPTPQRPLPPAGDVSDFLRELSQLSRDDD